MSYVQAFAGPEVQRIIPHVAGTTMTRRGATCAATRPAATGSTRRTTFSLTAKTTVMSRQTSRQGEQHGRPSVVSRGLEAFYRASCTVCVCWRALESGHGEKRRSLL